MVEKNFLLSLLEFVALVAPVIAILMQVMIAFHDNIGDDYTENSRLPLEFRILQLSLFLTITGGVLIGVKLIDFIDDSLVLAGVILVFGSLPFLAISLWLSNTRVSWGGDPSQKFHQHIWFRSKSVISVVVSLVVPSLVIGGPISFLRETVNRSFDYGVFYTNDLLAPISFFAIAAFVLGIKVIVSLIEAGDLPSDNLGPVIKESLSNSLVMLAVVSLFLMPVFLIFWGVEQYLNGVLSQIPFPIISNISLAPSNPLFNIPYLWATLILIAAFSADLSSSDEDEDQDEASNDEESTT